MQFLHMQIFFESEKGLLWAHKSKTNTKKLCADVRVVMINWGFNSTLANKEIDKFWQVVIRRRLIFQVEASMRSTECICNVYFGKFQFSFEIQDICAKVAPSCPFKQNGS